MSEKRYYYFQGEVRYHLNNEPFVRPIAGKDGEFKPLPSLRRTDWPRRDEQVLVFDKSNNDYRVGWCHHSGRIETNGVDYFEGANIEVYHLTPSLLETLTKRLPLEDK